MSKNKILSSLLVPLFLFSFLLVSGEINNSGGKLYHAEIKVDNITLLGYLYISSVQDSIHTHAGHAGHQCPVDSCFLGSYDRAVFGSKSGHNFFDLVFRHDTVTRVYVAHPLKQENVMMKVEQTVLTLIGSMKAQQPLERLSDSDPTMNMTLLFTLKTD